MPATGFEEAVLVATRRSVLLSVEDLRVHFPTDHGLVRAVDGVTFSIREGETLAVVGESGSGKSVTSLAIMGLLPRGRAIIPAGTIGFDGASLLALSEQERRRLRGNRMSMIFQEPMTSLNPVYPIGWQIAEVMVAHKGIGWRRGLARAVEQADVISIFETPLMPYTVGLLRSIPHWDHNAARSRRLQVIPGNVPNPLALPGGCDFRPRCQHQQPECAAIPPLEDSGGGHMVRCARWRALREPAAKPRVGTEAAR